MVQKLSSVAPSLEIAASWQAVSHTPLKSGVNGCGFFSCQFLLERLEMGEVQSIPLPDPDRVALRAFVEQAECLS